jgi:hypothetical protein
MMPTFYNSGTHAVVARRIYFDILKVINDIELVEMVKGTYIEGMASAGPSYERREKTISEVSYSFTYV